MNCPKCRSEKKVKAIFLCAAAMLTVLTVEKVTAQTGPGHFGLFKVADGRREDVIPFRFQAQRMLMLKFE